MQFIPAVPTPPQLSCAGSTGGVSSPALSPIAAVSSASCSASSASAPSPGSKPSTARRGACHPMASRLCAQDCRLHLRGNLMLAVPMDGVERAAEPPGQHAQGRLMRQTNLDPMPVLADADGADSHGGPRKSLLRPLCPIRHNATTPVMYKMT